MSIAQNWRRIRAQVPPSVVVVLACKTRSVEEVREAIAAGATDLGHNYVQEAEKMVEALGESGRQVRWHMIGPLQKNKINKALRVFDAIQTIHSFEQADAVNKRAGAMGKSVGVYLEINSGGETSKSGLPPDAHTVRPLADRIDALPHLRLEGLMTMGPWHEDPEKMRPYFRLTRTLFDSMKGDRPDFRHLSMGMSDSYGVAIEEGATMIRLGTVVFGPRIY